MFLLVTQGGVTAGAASSNEGVDLEMITRIRDEGFHRSKVMETLSELTDRIGPRLTGSPEMKKANEWTRDQLAAWGLENAHLESWGPFGRGWTDELTYVRMLSPDTAQLIAYPEAWTPGTNGVVRGKAIKVKLATPADLEKYRGKLGGMILLIDDPREVKPHAEPDMTRYSDQQLQDIYQYAAQERRGGPPFSREELIQRMRFRGPLMEFLKQEKPLAVINVSRGDDGTVFAGSSTALRSPWPVPDLVMATEQYDRIARLLERDVPVELELNVVTKFYDDDNMA